jgi:glycosyltransferase involved in cell wall biosynthesis
MCIRDRLGSALYKILDKHFDVQLLDKINPKVSIFDKFLNILKKKVGINSNFYFFSRNRLKKIAIIYSSKLDEKTSFLFFHGSTPWAHIIPNQKYIVLLDCSFKTYLTVYHAKSKFSGVDLNRLYKQDKAFLNNAELVLFTSSFALNRASIDYNLSTEKLISISQGPSIPASERHLDSVIKKKQFLFIASNFEGKGGLLIYNAFKQFSKSYSGYKLVIVGQKPPQYILDNNNVIYLGRRQRQMCIRDRHSTFSNNRSSK